MNHTKHCPKPKLLQKNRPVQRPGKATAILLLPLLLSASVPAMAAELPEQTAAVSRGCGAKGGYLYPGPDYPAGTAA